MSLKKLPFTLAIALMVSATLIVVLIARLTQPMFTVTNLSSESVQLSISWRDETKDLGTLEPDAELQFNLADEASAVFRVKTTDGREFVSSDIYFTQGVVVEADILTSDIRVKYRPEQ